MPEKPDAGGLIPKGVAHVELAGAATTQHVVFLLVPQFSMSAFSAAIEPLRIANQLTGRPLYQWEVISEDGDAIVASNGVKVGVDGGLRETDRDTIIFVCSGVEPLEMTSNAVANWIRLQWRLGRYVGGLCTGAYALAKAGILKNKSFTLHWENQAAFKEIYQELEPVEQLFVIDGRIVTCAGGSAATDLWAKLIKQDHGQLLSQSVLNMCLIPFQRSGSDLQKTFVTARIVSRNPTLAQIVRYFEDNIEAEIDLDAVGEAIGKSRRQIERLFKRHADITPMKFLSDMRLQRGRALLSETNLSVAEAATASGFTSTSHFSKLYRARYGHSPHHLLT